MTCFNKSLAVTSAAAVLSVGMLFGTSAQAGDDAVKARADVGAIGVGAHVDDSHAHAAVAIGNTRALGAKVGKSDEGSGAVAENGKNVGLGGVIGAGAGGTYK